MSQDGDLTAERDVQVRSPRWMRIALVLSVALNMLIVGFVAGAAWKFRHGGGFHPDFVIEKMAARQSEPVRTQMLKVWRETRERARVLRREARDARRKLGDVLRAETFDRAAFEAEKAVAMTKWTELRALRAGALADVAERLSAEDRRKLIDRLERMRRFRRWRRN